MCKLPHRKKVVDKVKSDEDIIKGEGGVGSWKRRTATT
jgi:hypothetical protein